MLVSVLEKQRPPESASSWFSWYAAFKQHVISDISKQIEVD